MLYKCKIFRIAAVEMNNHYMKVNNQSNDVQSIIVVHVFRNAAAEMIDCNDK